MATATIDKIGTYQMNDPFKVAVGIATVGRRELLIETLCELSHQTRRPDVVLVCPASEDDVDRRSAAGLPFPFQIVPGRRGLCAQRNAIIDASQGLDVLVFFDDDFIPGRSYLEELERCFVEQPEIVVITGNVIADGILGPGLDPAAARAKLLAFRPPRVETPLTDMYNGYGCNMAVRLAPLQGHSLRFDEELPLYGWLEDVDLCRRVSAYGRIVKNWNMIGVHLGSKRGRVAGIRLGYSQIANPIYLWRKGTLRPDFALVRMARNILANLAKLVSPEPWIDRRGRALGNALGFRDLLRGRLNPRRILDFD